MQTDLQNLFHKLVVLVFLHCFILGLGQCTLAQTHPGSQCVSSTDSSFSICHILLQVPLVQFVFFSSNLLILFLNQLSTFTLIYSFPYLLTVSFLKGLPRFYFHCISHNILNNILVTNFCFKHLNLNWYSFIFSNLTWSVQSY